MRLSYTSHHITDTTLVDDSGRRLYATTSSTFGRSTDVLKFGSVGSSTLASIHFHNWGSDGITLGGRRLKAKTYLTKPSWWSKRRVFTSASGQTYEWDRNGKAWRLRLFNGPEVGRSHSRSLGMLGSKHPAYLEISDDPRVLNDLDELVVSFIYVQIRREKDRRNNGAGAGAAAGAGA
ncbi:unnamed protein product [Peniophora sp. CBMAI 1063]|nr:unnamed protein product [Peniophora sp. CBMAI 1063]